MALTKGQQRVVDQARSWMDIDAADLYHSVAAMLSAEIRMARKDNQKREIHAIACRLGVTHSPKYITCMGA